MPPLVSVIIPTFNRAHCILRAINSVRSQDYFNWELIVVDNSSRDSTQEILRSIPDKRVRVINVNNFGVIAISRNLGIKYSTGKYIAFLDSDDWWLPNKLSESVKALEHGADIIYHDLFILGPKKSNVNYFRRIKTRKVLSPLFKNLIIGGNPISTSSVVVSRKLFLGINGFSEDPFLSGAEDYDAWIRLSKLTNKFKRLKNTMGFYWQGDDNLTSATRTIKVMLYLSKIYEKEFKKENHKYLLNSASFQYMLGKAKYQLNDLNNAKEHFSKIIKSGKINFTFIKACIWQVKLFFKKMTTPK
jgi:glycosyltransferase involved in cell wall biosynthesis